MPEFRFTGICLVSEDVPKLADFYVRLLGVSAEGDETFTSLSVAGAELSIFSASGMDAMAPGSTSGAGRGSFTIEIQVDDVDETFDRVRPAGAGIVKPLTTQPWGRRSVWLRDTDGNIINLYQPVPIAPPG
jgi:predicted enzyme related to lactoylglutathione lyase